MPGNKSYPRRWRLESLLRQELSVLVSPAFSAELLTVRGVSMSRDLGVATVFYSLAPGADTEAAHQKLQTSAARWRRELAKKLNMRRTPQLVFSPDDGGIAADKLRDFLEKVGGD
ncbi:MAG: ribosome-binding factor A [Gammaproteobacteria bacterium]